jgi:hypothetical protein
MGRPVDPSRLHTGTFHVQHHRPSCSHPGRSDPDFPVVADMGQPATGAVDDERRRRCGAAPDRPSNCASASSCLVLGPEWPTKDADVRK